MHFITTIRNTCLKQKLFSRGDRILVGVSGGPDSVALIHTLYALRHGLGLQLYIAHLNHGLRAQATVEQSYVKALAKKLGLPLFTKTISLQKSKGSLEEKAREARFKFLIETAKKIKAQGIALGHHQDDLAETILMRLLRGTGPTGIKSILPKRKINGVTILRPLLETNRHAIKKFLKGKNIKFYTDASNLNKTFLRNKIRLDLLPMLEKTYNPHIKKALVHFSQSVSLIYDYLKNQAEDVLKSLLSKNKRRSDIVLNIKKLLLLHPALLREMLRLAVEKRLGHHRGLAFTHIEEIENLIKNQPNGSMVYLPYKLVVQKKKDFIVIKGVKKRLLIKQKKTL
jgi:tRNA(Ile)-lysidine synthase